MTQHKGLLTVVRNRRAIARRSRPYSARRSKLERHRADIIALRQDGASLGDIQYFLRALAQPSVDVERSTIKRFIDRVETSAHG